MATKNALTSGYAFLHHGASHKSINHNQRRNVNRALIISNSRSPCVCCKSPCFWPPRPRQRRQALHLSPRRLRRQSSRTSSSSLKAAGESKASRSQSEEHAVHEGSTCAQEHSNQVYLKVQCSEAESEYKYDKDGRATRYSSSKFEYARSSIYIFVFAICIYFSRALEEQSRRFMRRSRRL